MFILSLILSFIIKLRFRNKSNFKFLRDRYGSGGVAAFRRLEKADLKSRKLQCDLEFLLCCLTNGLTPKFLNFNLALSRFRGNDDYREYQQKILSKEIEVKRTQILDNYDIMNEAYGELQSKFSLLDFNHFKNIILNNNIKKSKLFKIKHDRKLFRLGLRKKYDTIPHDKVIFNLTDLKLSPIQKEALSLGLNYCFKPPKLSHTKFFLAFEKFYQQLSSNKIYKCVPDAVNIVKATVKSLAFKTYYNFKPNIPIHQTRLVSVLKTLSNNDSIHVTKPDKSKGVVLMNKSDYVSKMNEILNDSSKFSEINDDIYKVLLRSEDRNNRLINQLFKDRIINEETKRKLFVSGSSPGRMYGLPKLHKKAIPLRPILSSIGTANYECSKYLVSALKDCINRKYIVNDSFEFCREITNLSHGELFMSSFDVCSLFTNVPVLETCNLILNKLFPHKNSQYLGFNRSIFKKLLDNCCLNNIFLFNGKLYSQVEGAPMGGCVSPVLADIFLSHYENIWLDECPESFRPVFYKRYVDDTFLLFRDRTHAEKFHNFINSRHEQIKFTYELECRNQIPFLDVLVKRTENGFETDLYRKPTNTGLGMKFFSEVPYKYKLNLIHTFLNRARLICSSQSSFSSEIENIKKFFFQNGFPLSIIDWQIKLKLDSFKKPIEKIDICVPKKPIYATFPYISKTSNKLISNELVNICKKFYPQLDLKVVFRNSFSVGSFFANKDRLPKLLQSNLVYSYICGQCNATYYGETSRHLKTRIAEHKGLSNRTGKPITNPSHSNIRDHSISTGHDLSSDFFKIIFKCNSSDLKISESILINHNSPDLNSMETSTNLNILA